RGGIRPPAPSGTAREAPDSDGSRCWAVPMAEDPVGEETGFGITAMIKARQERGWLITFLGEGLDVAQQGVQLGPAAANVAAYAGGGGVRPTGGGATHPANVGTKSPRGAAGKQRGG